MNRKVSPNGSVARKALDRRATEKPGRSGLTFLLTTPLILGWLVCLLLPLWGAAAHADTPSSQPSPVTAVPGLDYRDGKLGNGLQVIMIREPKAPIITSQVWYRVGAVDEETGKTGLAHMLEHMMFQGDTEEGPGQFSRIVARNGGDDNASTAADYTLYHINLASDRLELALRLESARMRELATSGEKFSSENKVVQEERRTSIDSDPFGGMQERFRAMAFAGHPYGRPIIGWMTDIEKLTVADLQAWHHRYYAPDNALLVLAGDLDFNRTWSLVERYFAPLPPRTRPSVAQSVAEAQPGAVGPPPKGERLEVADPRATLSVLQIAFPVPSLGEPGIDPDEVISLKLLAWVLGGGNSSLLYRRLVMEQGVAVSASVDHPWMSRHRDLFTITAVPRAGVSLATLEFSLFQEIAKVAEEAISAEEWERATNGIIAGHTYSRDSVYRTAWTVGRAWASHVDWHLALEEYPDRIRKITPVALRQVAAKYLQRDLAMVGTLTPASPDSTPAQVEEKSGTGLPPRPGTAVQTFTTPRGMVVYLFESHSNPMVEVRILAGGGSAQDPVGKEGLASLAAWMFNEGGGDLDAAAFHDRLDRFGIVLSAEAGRDTTEVTLTSLTQHLDVAWASLADALIRPRHDGANLERGRAELIASWANGRSDPDVVAGEALDRSLYGKHPYARPTGGTEDSLKGIGLTDVAGFHQELYRGRNMVMAVAGDVTPARLQELLSRHLSGLSDEPTALRPVPPAEGIPQEGPIHLPMDIPQSTVRLGVIGINRADPDFFPLLVLNHILGGGSFSSRLTEEIRQKRGLAYSVYSHFITDIGRGSWSIDTKSKTASAQEALALIRAEIARLYQDGVTEAELQQAKEYLTGSFPLRLSGLGNIASTWAIVAFHKRGTDYLEKWPERVRAVGRDDILRVARRLLVTSQWHVVTVGRNATPSADPSAGPGGPR
ncbi:MAG: insulinase family protein [Magnetococcales bacterium]|nr:insulinase family protein [Magnetococcales bacterium]